jgi:hypothetical protein
MIDEAASGTGARDRERGPGARAARARGCLALPGAGALAQNALCPTLSQTRRHRPRAAARSRRRRSRPSSARRCRRLRAAWRCTGGARFLGLSFAAGLHSNCVRPLVQGRACPSPLSPASAPTLSSPAGAAPGRERSSGRAGGARDRRGAAHHGAPAGGCRGWRRARRVAAAGPAAPERRRRPRRWGPPGAPEPGRLPGPRGCGRRPPPRCGAGACSGAASACSAGRGRPAAAAAVPC